MINCDMRNYDYFTFGEKDAYGQPTLSPEAQGTLKMAIYYDLSNLLISTTIIIKVVAKNK